MSEKTVQLQGVLLPDAAICNVEELYYHGKGNRTDFDGYFNLFYIGKRKRYTHIENLSLDLQLWGYSAVILVHDGEDIRTISLDPKVQKSYHIPLPYEQYRDGCFWFALIREEQGAEKHSVSGFYTTSLPEGWVREVRIGTVICTYKREAHVLRSLSQIKARILDRTDLNVSSRVKFYIIDNGKTLRDCKEMQELVTDCAGKTVILPNRNAGGAGGFTRGIIEVLETERQEGFTHVLLMDDDAAVEPDAFVRIQGLAETLKEEWKDITIGGALLREETPYIQYCAGELCTDGETITPEQNIDIRRRENASCGHMLGTELEHEMYSGWWLCCYSLGTIKANGLPLPLFIHFDDIEYGLRNREKGITFLNGVNVWHAGADARYSNPYYYIRNHLVCVALHQKRRQTLAVVKLLLLPAVSAMTRLKYRDLDLIYLGLADFLRGPGWLLGQDPEELNRKVTAMYYRLRPLKELQGEFTEEEYRDLQEQIRNKEEANRSGKREKNGFLRKGLAVIGMLLPGDSQIRVITPMDYSDEVFRRKKLLLYEPSGGRAMIVEKKYRKLMSGILLCVRMVCKTFQFRKVAETYRRETRKMTGMKTWKEYLEI